MKILLINPPRSPQNMILESAPPKARHFIHKKLIGPPLGLITIASAVKDYDVTVFDIKGEYDLNPDAPDLETLVLSYLDNIKPDIVGVTFIASEFDYGIEIFRIVKNFHPAILTVAGGLHATLCPDHFNRPEVDLICLGQAAAVFRQIVEAKKNQLSYESIGDILINTKEGLIPGQGKSRIINAAREHFIMPERSYLKRWYSTYKVGRDPRQETYLFTSLGCPYRCTFCSIWPQFNGQYYQREINSIIEELSRLPEFPIVRFADANTIVNIDFMDRLFDRILEAGIKKTIVMDIRADTAVNHPRLIEKMAKGGLKVVICGFESFRDQELKRYNKSSSANIIHKAIQIFHQNEIHLRGNYVIPNDYTETDFAALTEYADANRVAFAGYTILTPMPGTILYEQMKDQIIDHDLTKYNFFNCVLKTKLPLEKFYEAMGRLWLIKLGNEVI